MADVLHMTSLTCLRDVGEFDTMALPAKVLFWRTKAETTTKHRLPLLSEPLGITLKSIVVDMLHCLHLGVLQKFVSFVWWSLLRKNVWQIVSDSEEQRLAQSIPRLRSELLSFYPVFRNKWAGEQSATQISDLSMKTLGVKGRYELKTKGSMTRPLVPFSVVLLKKFAGVLPRHDELVATGEALDRMLVHLKDQPAAMTHPGVQRLHDLAKVALKHWLAAGIPTIPKLHAMLHLAARPFQANHLKQTSYVTPPSRQPGGHENGPERCEFHRSINTTDKTVRARETREGEKKHRFNKIRDAPGKKTHILAS